MFKLMPEEVWGVFREHEKEAKVRADSSETERVMCALGCGLTKEKVFNPH